MKTSELKRIIINEAEKMLAIDSPEEKQAPSGNEISDDLGTFFIVVHPNETDSKETIVKPVTLLDVISMASNGQLGGESIVAISKKESTATRIANRTLRGYNSSLKDSRRIQLKELERKRSGHSEKLSGTLKILGDRALDEKAKLKISAIESAIGGMDKEIAKLQALIKGK
jgi:hypothetical protein